MFPKPAQDAKMVDLEKEGEWPARRSSPPASTDSAAVQYENREVVGSKDSKSESKSDLEDITQADWTVEEETALRRKIDRRIVPLVTVLYLLCVRMPNSLEFYRR